MLEAAWRAGIRRIILAQLAYTSMIPYPSYEEVEHGNRAVYDLISRHPGRVFGYVYVNPNLPETRAIIEDGLARPGVVGIKLWISVSRHRRTARPSLPGAGVGSRPQDAGVDSCLLP